MSALTPVPVVGIGASAGGVDALETFFRNTPGDSGCAFVVVTHLGPDRPSFLPELLARCTTMPVTVAEQGPVIANAVYVMPPDTRLGFSGGVLQVHALEGRRERRPIDLFLAELSREKGEYAAGVILSGSDGDGTLGVKAIKEQGGLTLAQVADGHPPSHPDMPQSAISSGMIDFAIPVGDMGRRIKEFARSLAVLEGRLDDGGHEASARALSDARQDICGLMRNRTGHDFSGYKARTFLRRVQRRMDVNRLESPKAYLDRLREDSQEVAALFRDLLINVTSFFRDADAFVALEKIVIPKIFAGRGADETVRAWVPGCATGEEVFSIAMLMHEHLDTLAARPKVQIFATDIDDAALDVARTARYPAALLDSVSPERRRRFFRSDGGSYLLAKEIRELCIFSPHSIIRDPPFSRLDLVSCRNLLIYFGPDVQHQVIPTFHYALKPDGYLFIGTSENVSQFNDLFQPIDRKNRLFQSREKSTDRGHLALLFGSVPPAGRTGDLRRPSGLALRQLVDAHVLHAFAPAHVVVTRDGDVVHYSTRTGRYLEATPGAPSRQLVAMARRPLRLELRAALREAIDTGGRVVREGLAVEVDEGRLQAVSLTVQPLDARDGGEQLFLVVFTDVGPAVSAGEMAERPLAMDGEAAELDRELRDTRERLQSLVEEYETALEELKSSNEELVSVNEELQSTNEELEASKEELQSLNEELHTVNAELSSKVDSLDQANNDLNNIFESTRVATIFLDRDLIIRNYTPAVSHLFNILPSDRGRPLTDLSGRITLTTLADDVQEVLASGRMRERSVDLEGEQHVNYLLRMAPYRDSLQAIDGVVLTFFDVTSLTRAEAHQRVLIAELNHRVKNMLAIVIAIAEQTFRMSADPQDFKNRLVERVAAMGQSYELLSRETWTSARIEDLVSQHVRPFGLDRIDLAGEPLLLTPPQALSFGMILHELATNAGKYGALSDKAGRVAVAWQVRPAAMCDEIFLTWRESGGPGVVKPERQGFGLHLVERETAYSLEGRADIDFAPLGLRVTLRFPVRTA
jgi:two-component system CheB/CheR fusion protein